MPRRGRPRVAVPERVAVRGAGRSVRRRFSLQYVVAAPARQKRCGLCPGPSFHPGEGEQEALALAARAVGGPGCADHRARAAAIIGARHEQVTASSS